MAPFENRPSTWIILGMATLLFLVLLATAPHRESYAERRARECAALYAMARTSRDRIAISLKRPECMEVTER
jgi:hypothetical protein